MPRSRVSGPAPASPSPRIPAPTAPPGEAPRLESQNARILALLQIGPVSNTFLAGIALSYTRRLSDLRAAGHAVDIIHSRPDGFRLYALRWVAS